MVKGKWAQGIVPRNFFWVIKDQLAVSERPGGYGRNHRRVRRQEEIIWIREQGFTCVISLSPYSHNLHNYDELSVAWRHRPFSDSEDEVEEFARLDPEFQDLLTGGGKVLVHGEELGDRISGMMAGYLLRSGLVPTGARAIAITEQLLERQMGPTSRRLVTVARGLDRG